MAGVELRVSGFNSLVTRNPCKRANTCAFLVAAADGPRSTRTELDYKRVTPDGRYETRKSASVPGSVCGTCADGTSRERRICVSTPSRTVMASSVQLNWGDLHVYVAKRSTKVLPAASHGHLFQ